MVVIQIDEAMAALRDLLDRRDRGEFTDPEFFQMVAEGGPLTCIEVKHSSAVWADILTKWYKASDNLKAFLTAVAARHRDRSQPSDFAPNHA
jgi:hypothetical protein